MSHHSSSYRDRERRRSPSPRRRHDSPGPSRRDRRDGSPKKEGALPRSFDRESRESKDDQRTVLERMEKACDSQPMKLFLKCIREKAKVKVWTRNYKEVRGICSGYIEFFDKHWNLVMRDVEEIFLRPKKGKTPYLESIQDPDTVPEAKPKVPKEKKKPAEGDVAPPPPPPPATEPAGEGGVEKKKKRRKKKKNKMENRNVPHLFLRGDNIVMVAVCQVVEEEEVEDEEEGEEPEIIEIKIKTEE